MANLIYSAEGKFDWAAPDEELHTFVDDLERPISTYLYGRRMYEVMLFWETLSLDAERPVTGDFSEIWRAAPKVVYSETLESPSGAMTRIERNFDLEAIRSMKVRSPRDISIGGPTLAAQAIKARLVDEYHLFVTPIVIGGGTRWLPKGARVGLELVDEHRFSGGAIHLHYRSTS